MAAILGSDCPVFIEGKHSFAEGRGELLSPSETDLSGMILVLVNPGLEVNTAWAYSRVKPQSGRESLPLLLENPVASWKELIKNDFEDSVFAAYPLIKELKEALYSSGAVYASMTGSGSSVYGIFKSDPALPEKFAKYVIWSGRL